jgi:predicted dehydrogenase/nucleoside-diphosphate-sugar epimerase
MMIDEKVELPPVDIGHAKRPLLRVGIVGCGTVAEQFHLPILAGHERLRLAAVVDRDADRAKRCAQAYGVDVWRTDATELPDGIDAVVLASPPFHHAPGAIALMRRGIHVLVEKPMALNLREAEEMCRVAQQQGVVLSVGVYKRLLPVTRMLRSLVDREQYGRPLRFSMEWGGLGGFASATLAMLKKDFAGGGVLIDLGSHVFDQLAAVFGGTPEIEDYQDDSHGGIEADCEVTVRFARASASVPGTIRLSRVRNLSNTLRIECEQAILEVAVSERFAVTVRPIDPEVEPFSVRGLLPADVSWYESYRAEIDDFVDAIREGRQPELAGRSFLPTMSAIEACYRQRRPLTTPWIDEMPRRSVRRANSGKRRVLITGGGGFIGGRVCEILALRDQWSVRALVHNPSSGSRLARLPVELIHGDLQSDDDVRRAVESCDTVVHCAVGTAYGYPQQIYAVTVDGTRRLAAACRAVGVKRFVHLSSIGVHDRTRQGTIDHTTPLQVSRQDWYGYTKMLAERAVRAEERRGLSVAVLRPGCVYGPHGFTFVINPLRALAQGRLVLEDSATAPADTVFVDNLVEAIACAVDASPDAVFEQAFPISDGDDCTWGEYFDCFADLMRRSIPRTSRAEPMMTSAGPVGRLIDGIRDALFSVEAKSFAKRLLQSDPIGTVPRYFLERYPHLERRARSIAGMDAPTLYRRPAESSGDEIVRITARASHVTIEHARQQLGFEPPVRRDVALATTWQWAKYARIV